MGPLGASCKASWGRRGDTSWRNSGASVGVVFAKAKISYVRIRLRCVSEPSWGHLGAILGPSWGRLGAILGPSWAILGRLRRSYAILREKSEIAKNVEKPKENKRFGPSQASPGLPRWLQDGILTDCSPLRSHLEATWRRYAEEVGFRKPRWKKKIALRSVNGSSPAGCAALL